jgi:hypothetical protein
MNEQFKKEKGQFPETLENQKYKELRAAIDEENRIWQEIKNVLATTPDQKEAEKIILKQYASLIDEAMRKSRKTLDEWLEAILQAREKE